MVRVLGVCDSLRYSQTPLSAGIYLLFENRLLKYEGVSEVATLSVSKTEPAGSSPASLAMPRSGGTAALIRRLG